MTADTKQPTQTQQFDEAAINADLKPEHRWSGPGPMPDKWWGTDGTLVYRSYSDYCWD